MAFNSEREAKNAYKLFQKVCDGYKFKYDANDEKYRVELGINGDNMNVKIVFMANTNIDVAFVLSTLPFTVGASYVNDVAQAVNLINSRLSLGSFDFSEVKNEIVFRMATNYTGMEATKEAIEPLLLFTYSCVNKYNKHLYQVATGQMSFAQFDAMMQGA
jgi:hypothetical protein